MPPRVGDPTAGPHTAPWWPPQEPRGRAPHPPKPRQGQPPAAGQRWVGCVRRAVCWSAASPSPEPAAWWGSRTHQMQRLGTCWARADGCLEGAVAPGPEQQGLAASPAPPACSPAEGSWGSGGGEALANAGSAISRRLGCRSKCHLYCGDKVARGRGPRPGSGREPGWGSSCLMGAAPPAPGQAQAPGGGEALWPRPRAGTGRPAGPGAGSRRQCPWTAGPAAASPPSRGAGGPGRAPASPAA